MPRSSRAEPTTGPGLQRAVLPAKAPPAWWAGSSVGGAGGACARPTAARRSTCAPPACGRPVLPGGPAAAGWPGRSWSALGPHRAGRGSSRRLARCVWQRSRPCVPNASRARPSGPSAWSGRPLAPSGRPGRTQPSSRPSAWWPGSGSGVGQRRSVTSSRGKKRRPGSDARGPWRCRGVNARRSGAWRGLSPPGGRHRKRPRRTAKRASVGW